MFVCLKMPSVVTFSFVNLGKHTIWIDHPLKASLHSKLCSLLLYLSKYDIYNKTNTFQNSFEISKSKYKNVSYILRLE